MPQLETGTFESRPLTKEDYSLLFREQIFELMRDYNWFQRSTQKDDVELTTACLNLSSTEEIASIIQRKSVLSWSDPGPFTDIQEICNAVNFVRSELDSLFARSGQGVWETYDFCGDLYQSYLYVSSYFKNDHLNIGFIHLRADMISRDKRVSRFHRVTRNPAILNSGYTEYPGSKMCLRNEEAYVERSYINGFKEKGVARKTIRNPRDPSTTVYGLRAYKYEPFEHRRWMVTPDGSEWYYKMEFNLDKLAEYDPVGVERYRKLHADKNKLKKEETTATEKVPADISEEQNARPAMKHRR